MPVNKEREERAKEFARKHWPEALAATVTIAGAAALLLIRYYKQKEKRLTGGSLEHLEVLEDEARSGIQEIPVLIETGEEVMRALPGADEIAQVMSDQIPDSEGQTAMATLAATGKPKRGK